ncbi:MAG: hypothetical protein HC811_03635 [Flammeovirgaceae bacterium]|nr:hypothetical protein [Flammeovirgaceae bacterium]
MNLKLKFQKQKPAQKKILTSAKEGDDLTEIKGVGPVISRKLNGMGIFSFQQIADMSDETVEKLSQTILRFPKRILKDNWREQAAKLVRQKKSSS